MLNRDEITDICSKFIQKGSFTEWKKTLQSAPLQLTRTKMLKQYQTLQQHNKIINYLFLFSCLVPVIAFRKISVLSEMSGIIVKTGMTGILVVAWWKIGGLYLGKHERNNQMQLFGKYRDGWRRYGISGDLNQLDNQKLEKL